MLLITTALKETWLTESEFERVFLGEWCKLYSEKSSWDSLKFKVIPYHWDDRNKVKLDHDYLKNFYEIVLNSLTEKLNYIHCINESSNFWRIILGPWLITYIPLLFDRWVMLEKAFETNNNLSTVISEIEDSDFMVASDFSNFLELMQTDSWNFYIYQRILINKYSNRFEKIEIRPIKNVLKSLKTNSSISFKKRLLYLLDNLVGFINIKTRIFFYKSYFTPLKLILLSLSLNQLPQNYHKLFNFNFTKRICSNFRNSVLLNNNQMNEFESFLFNNIFKDIPIAYLEEFSDIRIKTDPLGLSYNTVLTANAYWDDDIFKIWLAKKRQYGMKLYISQHGGSFPPLFDTFNHEEDISDKYITWFKPYHYKHIQLPPNKIDKYHLTNGKSCSLIGFESPRYSYRITGGPISFQTMLVFNQSLVFCDYLNQEIKNNLVIRPYQDMGWQTKQRYIDKLSSNVIDKSTSFKMFIKKSKILICTYPQTTFSEAMASGKPTILLFVPDHNQVILEAELLLESLKEVNIVFTDPILAAEHINYIWNDVDVWWNSKDVVNARNIYFYNALRISNNWKKEWFEFLIS